MVFLARKECPMVPYASILSLFPLSDVLTLLTDCDSNFFPFALLLNLNSHLLLEPTFSSVVL